MGVPEIRIRRCNRATVRADGRYVLYWMTANRRTGFNFSLERAVEHARELARPLLILETLSCGGRWDTDRSHTFALEGMADNQKRLKKRAVAYYPHVERRKGSAAGLMRVLRDDACAVVTDDFPTAGVPALAARAAAGAKVLVEAVDSNGLLPMRAEERVFSTAYAFRRSLQTQLREHLADFPRENPLARARLPRLRSLSGAISAKWPRPAAGQLKNPAGLVARLPVDHGVGPVDLTGGAAAARKALRAFVDARLDRYAAERNEPEKDATSGLSPWLAWGHVSVHEVFSAIAERERWSLDRLAGKASGRREGWWGMGGDAEAFLDELVTWREVGFNMCSKWDDYDRYASLPYWARETLEKHAGDSRPYVYRRREFEKARTHDQLWNAAQRQLLREGRIHNYLRMLWGKKILEWSPSPAAALKNMVELNNKYALDGRNPNSYTGIFWVLGRYDRPWGPERPVFGKVRYMSSQNTARKVRVRDYIDRYAARWA